MFKLAAAINPFRAMIMRSRQAIRTMSAAAKVDLKAQVDDFYNAPNLTAYMNYAMYPVPAGVTLTFSYFDKNKKEIHITATKKGGSIEFDIECPKNQKTFNPEEIMAIYQFPKALKAMHESNPFQPGASYGFLVNERQPGDLPLNEFNVFLPPDSKFAGQAVVTLSAKPQKKGHSNPLTDVEPSTRTVRPR